MRTYAVSLMLAAILLGALIPALADNASAAGGCCPDPPAPSDTTHFVDAAGFGNYTTIQAAVDNSSAGDLIYVLTGTYNESVVVDIPLTIVGDGSNVSGVAVINAPSGGAAMTIDADNVTVNLIGLTGERTSTGLVIRGSNASITNCLASDLGVGFLLDGANNSELFACLAYDCDAGFVLNDSSMCVLGTNNALLCNETGFLVDGSAGNLLVENLADNNTGYAVKIVNGTGNQVYRNYLFANNAGGVQAYDDSAGNEWDYMGEGNIWSDYPAKFPTATYENFTWSEPYPIDGPAGSFDHYPLASDDYSDPGAGNDTDGDGYLDALDMFPLDRSEHVDRDGDGIGDNADDFPSDPAASKDTDHDLRPDEWNPNKTSEDSTTGLILDKYPDDPANGMLDESDDGSNMYPYAAIAMVAVVTIIVIAVFIVKSRSAESEPDGPVRPGMRNQYNRYGRPQGTSSVYGRGPAGQAPRYGRQTPPGGRPGYARGRQGQSYPQDGSGSKGSGIGLR